MSSKEKSEPFEFGSVGYGGAYGIRTRDLHTASVARSQLRQYPMHCIISHIAEKIKGVNQIFFKNFLQSTAEKIKLFPNISSFFSVLG